MKSKDQIPADVSPVFARAAVRPQVQAPDSPWTVWVGIGGAAVLGFMVFNGLSSSREAKAQTTAAPAMRPAPLVTAAPPTSTVQAPPATMATPAPIVQQSVAPPSDPEQAHWRAPTVVVDFGGQGEAAPQVMAQAGAAAPMGPQPRPIDPAQSADERFAARVNSAAGDVARATQIRDLGRTVPQGAVIAAVLETAIDSNLPGSVRGVVSRDVRSFDGSRVLIPRGSKLVGQYKSSAALGQTRAFVIWTRIITPTGVAVDVSSPATDRVGRGGLEGAVDTHFFQRFGAAILLSAISTGLNAVAAGGNDNTTLVIGSPMQANQVATAALQQQMDIPVTIKVPPGVPVQVFVARDLDFSGVVR